LHASEDRTARGFFITLLVSRSGSWMRKSFALCEAFGLTPFGPPGLAARTGRDGPLPLALDPERTRGALRREAAADPAVRGGGLLREGQGWG
jgi:hypothetical protein